MLEQALALVFKLLLVYKTHQCAITTLSDCNCVIECNALIHCDCNVKPCRAILHWDTIVLLSGTLQTLPLPQCTFTILWQTIFNGFLLRADSASRMFLLLTSLFVSHILTTAPKMGWLKKVYDKTKAFCSNTKNVRLLDAKNLHCLDHTRTFSK